MAKLSKRVRKHSSKKLTPALSVKAKKRPRGKSFEKGNGWGSEHRFKPGQSGNPGGRPKSAELSTALKAKLRSDTTRKLKARTYAEKLCDELVAQGLDGNVSAIIAIGDRTEGKPAVTILDDGRPNQLTLLIDSMANRSRELGHPEGWVPPLQLEAGDSEEEAASDE